MNKNNTLKKIEALRKMRTIFEDESKWCKGAAAKDKNGDVCYPWSETATQWCFSGVVRFVSGGRFASLPAFDLVMELRENLNKTITIDNTNEYCGIIGFNDDPKTTLADVKRVIDATIARLEAGQSA